MICLQKVFYGYLGAFLGGEQMFIRLFGSVGSNCTLAPGLPNPKGLIRSLTWVILVTFFKKSEKFFAKNDFFLFFYVY